MKGTLEQRFWPKVSVQTEGCWDWLASIDACGYGRMGDGTGRNGTAHRIAWTLHFGSIPNGLCVLHKCDNRSCVRPDHLFLGTQVDNIYDMVRKGRHRCFIGDSRPYAKLSADDVRAIRSIPVELWHTHTTSQLANVFGVSYGAIRDIHTRNDWKALS